MILKLGILKEKRRDRLDNASSRLPRFNWSGRGARSRKKTVL
ncbi:hypothetical protein [Microcoleus sp. FACHB-1515]|nr:hypothetical protein [Microcoleus sp. FACHB-1515]